MRMDSVFSVLAFFTLVSGDYVSAFFSAITQESPVVAEVGEMAIFPCHTSRNYVLAEVRWTRVYVDRRYLINVFFGGKDQQRCDTTEYVGRTELVTEDLSRGSVALKLFNVSVADEGTYLCYLETVDYFDYGKHELRVTALGSDPRIDMEGFQDGRIKVVCRSAGWYPEPMLVNKDTDGEMTIQQEENGLYSIEYSRLITENSNRPFSCRLRTSFHSPDQETSVYVADALFQEGTNTVTLIVLCTIGYVLAAAAAATATFHIWTRHRNAQDVSSAVYTEPRYLKVPLDQDVSCVNEQSPMCAVKNIIELSPPALQSQDTIHHLQVSATKDKTKGSPPVVQSQDTIEQTQMCAMKNTTKGSPPVLQSQETIEESQVCAVRNITKGNPPVLQSQDTIEQPQVSAVKNTTKGSPPVLKSQDIIEQSQMCAMKNTTKGSPPVLHAQYTIEHSEVGAVKNTTTEGSPLYYSQRIQLNSLECAVKNTTKHKRESFYTTAKG